MVTWIVVGTLVLLWIVVAGWRASVFIGKDMVETWEANGNYDELVYGEAIRAGVRHGLGWPFLLIGWLFMSAVRAIGKLLWAWAYHYAKNLHASLHPEADPEVTGEIPKYQDDETLIVTDEIAEVEPEEIPETRQQRTLRRQAEEARAEYQAQQARHLADETAIGAIPAYEPRRAAT